MLRPQALYVRSRSRIKMKYNLCIVLALSMAFLVSQWEPINAVSDDGSQITRKPTFAGNMSPSNGVKPVNYFLKTEAISNMLAADSFKKFMKKFHRIYSGPAEFAMRQAVFTAKLLKIFMHNLKYSAGLVRYSLKIGPFADKTEAEFDALFTHEDTTLFEELITKNGNGSDPASTENKHNDDYEELHDDNDATDKPRFESIPVSMWGGNDDDGQYPNPYQYYDPYGNPIAPYSYQPSGYDPYNDYMNQAGSSSGQPPWDPNYNYNYQYYSGQSANAPDDDDTAGGSAERRPNQMFVDYRNCFTPAKDQKNCRACWSFAGISMLEYYHCMQTGVGYPIAFSEQYWIDCGHKFIYKGRVPFQGCNSGGDPRRLHLLAEKLGLLEEAFRPYVGGDRTCESTASGKFQPLGNVKVEIRGVSDVKKKIGSFLQENIELGPIYVSMRKPSDFKDMGKGVNPGKDCETGGHGMVVVGHGTEDNEQFWLIRNSYGRDWGDEGYWKLSKNAEDRCFKYAIQWGSVYFPVVSQFVGHRSSSSSTPPASPPASEPGSSPEDSYDQSKKKKQKSLWRKLGLGG